MKRRDSRAIRISLVLLSIAGFLGAADGALADSTAIDRIYHPYVQLLERELEIRGNVEDSSTQSWRVGYSQALNESHSLELYLIGTETQDNFRLSAYELELLWQLSEQGEYAADWGLLFELERSSRDDINEFATGLLVESAWRRWSATANLYGIMEFGGDIKDEFETALALQLRYRHSPLFEPALELFSGENTRALGPAVMGTLRLGAARGLHWETGLAFGLDSDTPDSTWKLLLEYEF